MRPLKGVEVIEMAGIAPSPYCGMILADFGARVMVVDRPAAEQPELPLPMDKSPFGRGKRSVRINLKTREGISILKRMLVNSDVLIEPYRPGVMERLGLGPEEALELNPGLIYARLTGWGQLGPYAGLAGHDINYIAVSGALSLFRRRGERPLPPCNLLGDFAGGGLLCALGILLALVERQRSGKGQVVDAAMVDGACYLSTLFHGLLAHGLMPSDIGANELDGGAHFYQTYETRDGRFIAVGALEGRFYEELLAGLNLDPSTLPERNDPRTWPEMTARFAAIFRTRTRDEWMAVFEGRDACVAPVLELEEVARHPHGRSRGLLGLADGYLQPSPAPRLSRTPGRITGPCPPKGTNTREALEGLGYSEEEIEALYAKRVVA